MKKGTDTVTFLFSDIEGSTKLLQKLGKDYVNLLDKHQKILREAFLINNGEVIDTAGDGFFVVFKSAKDAIAASVASQKLISENVWVENVKLKVRMGIHTGEPETSGPGYVGIDVHRAARIMSSGYGGQVLISESTRILAEKELPKGIRLKYLGEFNLKDLEYSEKLYQLIIPGLQSEFPSIKSISSRQTNLPSEIIKLIGREKELDYLKKEILSESPSRLVTITGTGGIGKTSLGLNLCSQLIPEFEDGVYVVFLASINDESMVPSAISSALGLSESSVSSLEQLKDFLKDKNLLLFLDNYEQIINSAMIVNDIINHCPKIKIIVTSRIFLNVKHEKEFTLNSLSLPSEKDFSELEKLSQFAAIQLFIERAKKVKQDFLISNENAAAIGEICMQLDGLPLAIELACARMKLFTPQMLLSKLSNKLNLLKGSERDHPERHQTLRQTILWSYDLLSGDEKKLFEALSVFTNGCTFEAIEYVCVQLFESDIELMDCVQALVEKSLLRREDIRPDSTRYNMLVTIHEFSYEIFKNSENFIITKTRHADYYLILLEEAEPHLTGKEIAYWLDVIESDFSNIDSALKWAEVNKDTKIALKLCASFWRYWIIRGNLRRGYERMKNVLSMPYDDSLKSLRAKVLNGIGTIVHELSDYDIAYPLIEESLNLYKEVNDDKGTVNALINLAWVSIHLGELNKGEHLCEEALIINKKTDDRRSTAVVYNNLAWSCIMKGNFIKAKDYYLKSYDIRVLLEEKRGMGFMLANLGWVDVFLGNYLESEKNFKDSLEIITILSDKQLTSWTLSNYGLLKYTICNFDEAKKIYKEAIFYGKDALNEWSLTYDTYLYGLLLFQEKDFENSKKKIEKALTYFTKAGSRWGIEGALTGYGNLLIAMKDFRGAKDCLQEAYAIAIYLNDRFGIVTILESLAYLVNESGNEFDARKLLATANKLREELQTPMSPVDKRMFGDSFVELIKNNGEILSVDEAIKLGMGIKVGI